MFQRLSEYRNIGKKLQEGNANRFITEFGKNNSAVRGIFYDTDGPKATSALPGFGKVG